MNCNIVLSGPIIRYTNFQKELSFATDSPQGALHELVGAYPKLADVLFNDGQWNDSVAIFCDSKKQKFTEMSGEGDSCELHLVVPLVGG
ncbi:MAG: hypothetical protein ABFR97_09275 [Thermodesulfobacteriota bacterium]